MKRAIWILVALALVAVVALMSIAPAGEERTGDPRTVGGPTVPG